MAVQVSGVHLGGVEMDPEPLRGIKTFVHGILPHRPHASPEGGTTPVLSDPGLEDTWTDNSHLKRKSCLEKNESADSDESESEHLPSSKRQRITVSAMRRLFAKFSLSDTDETSQPAPAEAFRPSARDATPRQSPEREDAPQSNTEDVRRTETQEGDTIQFTVKLRHEKRISETDGDEEHGDKRRKTNDRENQSDDNQDVIETETDKTETENHEAETSDEADKTIAKSEDSSKSNKRQAEARESDAEDRGENGSKVKRTRRLRRGLRLCANVTCYIEQVLYN
ncbi:protein starmaker-like [Eriocheir sinensis]|uniref:protein starmaker-like n=1 Tax=Eriocheir sinensis TaxID=95602 RepID=UPI0021C9C9D9|nr:protein starmaker-like [Eriocheir sinensis]